MSAPKRGPAYRIRTERTILRCWNPQDAPLLQEALNASLEHLRPWMPWVEQEPEEVPAKAERLRTFRANFDLGNEFIYAIFDHEETAVLGGTGLHGRPGTGALEIGYWIHVDQINRGLATEIASALTRVAFEIHEVNRVEIHCDPRNVRSARVPAKLGYTHEATLRQRLLLPNGTYRDSMIWTLLAQDYRSSPASVVSLNAYDAIGAQIL